VEHLVLAPNQSLAKFTQANSNHSEFNEKIR
jgi:hypothetical protein